MTSRVARPGPPVEDPTSRRAPRPDGGDYELAMARAGRLLAARPRTAAELRRKLREGGTADIVAEQALERLRELRLVDDAAFASEWVAQRGGSRSASALAQELVLRGVGRDVAEAAVAEAGVDDHATAVALAADHVRRVASLPLTKQAARIGAMLSRRGYSSEVIEVALRAVLPPEGWD